MQASKEKVQQSPQNRKGNAPFFGLKSSSELPFFHPASIQPKFRIGQSDNKKENSWERQVTLKFEKTPKVHQLKPTVRRGPHQLIQQRALTVPERKAAIAHARATFDEMSVRVIQNVAGLTGRNIDGDFGRNTARAVSDYQTNNHIAPDDGRVLQGTLDTMIINRRLANRRNEAIHLATDFFNLNVSSETLAVYSEPGASRPNPTPPPATFPADTTFESGGLRVIRVGTPAFADAATLRDTINRELTRPAPGGAAGPPAPRPNLLNRTEERSAMRYMKRHYQDRRSIMALQGTFVGVHPTGAIDADLVQRIAQEQDNTGTLTVDGKVGRNTLEHFFVQLRDSGSQNAAIRIVMDFYDMPDYQNLLAIYYEAPVGASTIRNPRGPVHVRLGQALFLPFNAMVHTLRHELEHVGHHRKGILSPNAREFLSEANEVISPGMPHETLFTVTAGGLVSGFQHDVNRMMNNWDLMTTAPNGGDQRRYWSTFVRARRVIRGRINRTYTRTQTADRAEWAAATLAQRTTLQNLLTRVNAAVRP